MDSGGPSRGGRITTFVDVVAQDVDVVKARTRYPLEQGNFRFDLAHAVVLFVGSLRIGFAFFFTQPFSLSKIFLELVYDRVFA